MGIFSFFNKNGAKDNKYNIGDTFVFGKYHFKSEKDIQPIEWIVLENNCKELLLISKYCLDTVKYCEPSASFVGTDCCIWENSYLRNWLNGSFYNQAFSESEKNSIIETAIITEETLHAELHKNKVFILSKSQIEDFFADNEKRKGFPTPYALQKGANTGHTDEKTTWWWTMPYIDITGGQPPRADYPSVVCQNGEINYHSRLVYHSDFTVRPVIRIKK